jgi:hypothetical protein
VPYTTSALVKLSLVGKPGASPVDVREDLITQAVAAAHALIDDRCGRTFELDAAPTSRTFPARDRYLSTPDGAQHLRIDDLGDGTGLTVEIRNTFAGTWAPIVGWELGPDNAPADGIPWTWIAAAAGWLTEATKVRITGRWGWPAIPDGVKQAATLLAARLYRRRDSPEGVLGSSEWGALRVSRFDPDVETLIAPYILITA